jgi:hypothetical protein
MKTPTSVVRIKFALLVALLLAVGLAAPAPRAALAQPARFVFTPLAFLGDAAPGGGSFINDFEPGRITANGDVSFLADVTTGGEGVFLASRGKLSQIVRSGQSLPSGVTVGPGIWFPVAINNRRNGTFTPILEPFTLPVGTNSGVYRFSKNTPTVTAVMVPYHTPAPGGGTFQGAYLHTDLNNNGDIVFAGIIPTPNGIADGRGMGVFRADRLGNIFSVVSPGDPAPGGGKFDFAENPSINPVGDIGFGAHVAGEECIPFPDGPQQVRIGCRESVYIRKATTGEIQSIAHQGQPAPGGGTYRYAFGPVLNNLGDMVFIADLTPAPAVDQASGVFLRSGGVTIPVARPGDPMPGGGKFARASDRITNYHLNNKGDVSFSALLDTGEHGLYVRSSRGVLRLVAKTGTTIPGIGTIATLNFFGEPVPTAGTIINDAGQVLFAAMLTDGRGVVLVATPSP